MNYKPVLARGQDATMAATTEVNAYRLCNRQLDRVRQGGAVKREGESSEKEWKRGSGAGLVSSSAEPLFPAF